MSKSLDRVIIRRAHALIADERHWSWGALARDETGQRIDPTDVKARRWCAYGALIVAANELVGDLNLAHHLAASATRQLPCCSLIKINDTQGHAAALALFEKAITAN